jgi:hypothetical protein
MYKGTDTGLIKHILLGNFWSFLLVLSGIVDIAIGLSILTGLIAVKNSPFSISIVCFVIGVIYLAAGLAIALFKIKKQAGDSS